MKSRIIHFIAFAIMLIAATSCKDDIDFYPGAIGDGEAAISAEVTFEPLVSALESRATGGTDGKAIGAIESLDVYFFHRSGIFHKRYHFTKDQLNITDNKITANDAVAVGSGEHQAESSTQTAEFQIAPVPMGEYQIYAIANVPESVLKPLEADGASLTPDKLKYILLEWNENDISANNQMFGYFSGTDKENSASAGFSAPHIAINKRNMKLHAWIKRAASKVTVAFDGSGLKDGVEIFIKSVQIKDIPASCLLGHDNSPGSYTDEELKKMSTDNLLTPNELSEINRLITNGQTISYLPNGMETAPTDPNKYNSEWPGYVSNRHPINGYDQNIVNSSESNVNKLEALHGENINALYFYENMQGMGTDGTPTDKRQQVNDQHRNDHIVSYPGGVDPTDIAWKDAKKYGSYIEVQAYYRSNNSVEKEGDITYRFMLGKDTHLDYNAQRNYHYKLTLMFNGWANDVDWHIDYKKDNRPPLRFPRPFYISYLYNHNSMIPLEFDADTTVSITKIETSIVENNWVPEGCTYGLDLKLNYSDIKGSQPGPSDWGKFYRYLNDPDIINKHPWNGFLSLKKPLHPQVIPEPEDLSHTAPSTLNKAYYEGQGYGSREYNSDQLKISSYPLYRAMDEDKPHVSWDNGTYYVKLPIWTRARQMITRTGYTGNNIYNAYYRNARVNVKIHLSDGRVLDSSDIDVTGTSDIGQNILVKQVRRLVNPKGIYRSLSKNDDFHVVLKILESDADTEFKPLKSDGPWRAYVILQTENFITLQGAPNTTNSNYTFQFNNNVLTRPSIEGTDKSKIDFTIKFNGAATTPRYAIIRVEYNFNSCYHLIFVRQGMEAHDTFGDGRKWCTGNNIDQSVIAQNPLDEGSLFKFGNWVGIKSESNVNNKEIWRLVTPNDFKGNSGNKALKWTNGTTGNWDTQSGKNPNGNSFESQTGYSVATHADYMSFINNENIRTGYGVCYYDGATETASNINDVFGHKGTQDDSKGMRGCFVYDITTGGNLFFPIGSSGYGHRKDNGKSWNGDEWPTDVKGLLRYACNGRWGYFNGVTADFYKYGIFDAPLFLDIFRSDGALYWFNTAFKLDKPDPDGNSVFAAWDINYSTLDFNRISSGNLGDGIDACFVRSIER